MSACWDFRGNFRHGEVYIAIAIFSVSRLISSPTPRSSLCIPPFLRDLNFSISKNWKVKRAFQHISATLFDFISWSLTLYSLSFYRRRSTLEPFSALERQRRWSLCFFGGRRRNPGHQLADPLPRQLRRPRRRRGRQRDSPRLSRARHEHKSICIHCHDILLLRSWRPEFPLFAKSNCDPNGVFQFPGGGGGMAPYQFHALALPSASVRLARVELTCGQRSQRRPRRPMKSAEARRGPRDPREPARPARGPESRETSQKNPL